MARRMLTHDREMLKTRRGFTLVELMIVVAIVGILAALGLYGLRRYQQYASTGEATAMLQGMRGAQENFKAETLGYAGCDATGLNIAGAPLVAGDFFPRATGALNDQKFAYDTTTGTPLANCFRTVGVRSSGPLRFTYGMLAGAPGTAMQAQPGPVAFAQPFPGYAAPPEPWYTLVAYADRDNDGVLARLMTTSFTNHIYMEEDTE